MRERLVVLALAAGALGLFYALFFPKPQGGTTAAETGGPLSNDSRSDGYLAVWRWLQREHIPAVSLRYRYDHLTALTTAPTGNLLLVTMPQRVATRIAELAALGSWVRRGNSLLIVAALDDEPGWALDNSDPLLEQRLRTLTGLDFEAATSTDTLVKSLVARQLSLRPRDRQPLLADVASVTARMPWPARSWHPKPGGARLPLELANRADNGDAAMWLERRGAGQVILMAVASPFSNAGLTLGDNARLLTNIISWSRGPGGAVIFDDAHQGLTAYYDANAFFADPRLHHTLAWLLFLWLAFVLGSQPLRARRNEWEPVGESAYVEAAARYLAAVVRPAEAGQRLIEDFLDSLRLRLRSAAAADAAAGASTDAIWPWVAAQACVSAAQHRELQATYARACAGERINLTRLQNLLAQLRRNLA